MTHSFSFGFGSDDIGENWYENGDGIVETGLSCGPPENKLVAATEPKLHTLQDLV